MSEIPFKIKTSAACPSGMFALVHEPRIVQFVKPPTGLAELDIRNVGDDAYEVRDRETGVQLAVLTRFASDVP